MEKVVKKYGLIVEIVEKDIQEWYAHELEVALIAYYGRRDQGRGSLVNLTDGGEGSSGYRHTEAMLGKNHPNFDPTIWKFKNVYTGEYHYATQYDFSNKYPDLNVRSLVGRKTSTFGWVIDGYTPEIIVNKLLQGSAGENNSNADLSVHWFKNLKTDEVFVGTRCEFYGKYGFNPSLLFCTNPRKVVKNWCLNTSKNSASFSPKTDYSKYKFINENGDMFIGTRKDMENHCGFMIHDLVRKDIKKRAKKIRGWALLKEDV